MTRTGTRACITGAVVGFVVALTPMSAEAMINSAWKPFITAGINYQNKSMMADDKSQAWGVVTRDSGYAGVGTMGAKARVFFDGGSLCSDTVFTYNNLSTSEWYVLMSDNPCGGYIFSKAASNTYTGSGYEFTSSYPTRTVYR